METMLINGDYVADGLGGIQRCSGADALLQRALFRLTARRGQFPMMPDLGSRLYLLGRIPPAQRRTAARQYAAEALQKEDVTVISVELSPLQDNHMNISVLLDYHGTDLTVTLTT